MFKLFSRRGHDDDRISSVSTTSSALPTSSSPAPPGSSDAVPFSEAASDVPPPSPPGSSPPGGGDSSSSHGHLDLNGLTLDDITRGMQRAAASANQVLAQQYTALLDQFFDADEVDTLVAREVRLALDSQHRLTLPLVSLTMSRDLAFDEMTVNMTVCSDVAETLSVRGVATGGVDRFYVSLVPHSRRDTDRDSEHIDIEMKFTALQAPEAIMRVIDEYTDRLVPWPVQPNAEAPDGRINPSTPQEKNDEHWTQPARHR